MSVPQKIKILKFIAEQGIVTIDDINLALFQKDKTSSVRVTLHQAGVGHEKFGSIKYGVWYISDPKLFELIQTYFPDLPDFQPRPLLLHNVPHSLEINRIRIALEKSDRVNVVRWWSEGYIRALPLSMREDVTNTKIPDAIFWRKKADGSEQRYFLEYERTLKNKERYDEIFRFYASRPDAGTKNIIYICENEFIKTELEDVELKMVKSGKLDEAGMTFQFVTKDSFYKTHANA